jgi:hypothetical protein
MRDWEVFSEDFQAATSRPIVGLSGIRRRRHCLVITLKQAHAAPCRASRGRKRLLGVHRGSVARSRGRVQPSSSGAIGVHRHSPITRRRSPRRALTSPGPVSARCRAEPGFYPAEHGLEGRRLFPRKQAVGPRAVHSEPGVAAARPVLFLHYQRSLPLHHEPSWSCSAQPAWAIEKPAAGADSPCPAQ